MFAEAATDLREMKSGVALLWKAPKAYDSHRDKLLRRVDAETEHSWVAKKRSLGCLPFESFILGNVLCLRFSLIDCIVDPKYHKSPFITFGCKVADGYGTHPTHCISELMRILMDVKGISWKESKVANEALEIP
ncbi:alpha-1,4 glucan phosphorylase L isozyme, chloroplastic/amyloplastic isoform X2 [Tanacetum coccineum]